MPFFDRAAAAAGSYLGGATGHHNDSTDTQGGYGGVRVWTVTTAEFKHALDLKYPPNPGDSTGSGLSTTQGEDFIWLIEGEPARPS